MEEKVMKEQDTIITFWGGIETIGGSIVSFQKGRYRLITDFGAYVGVDVEELADETQTLALLKEGKLPPIPDFYEDNELQTIVCLTHLHLDHLGSLNHLPKDIEVWLSQEAYTFYQALEQSNYLPKYAVKWRPVEWEETLTFGPFTIQFLPSDHDTLGAAAIFIETEDLKVIQSGDFRLSGFRPDDVWQWVQKARHFKPDLLLIEGTAFSFDEAIDPPRDPIEDHIIPLKKATEKALVKTVQDLGQKEEVMVYNGYSQNIERLMALIQLMSQLNRQVVVSSRMKELLDQMTDQPLNVLSWSDDLIELIRAHPQNYFIQIEAEDTFIFERIPSGIYLHSNGMPLGNFMPGYVEYVQHIISHGWQFTDLSSSGHATKNDLLTVSYMINAELTVGWHTFGAENYQIALEEIGLRSFLPEIGKNYSSCEINH